jgi:2-iminobutanoate/2-iminopropanoate deaminase
MAGLDPVIHPLRKDCLQKAMDCRVKPGNDEDTGRVSKDEATGLSVPSRLIRLAHTRGDPMPIQHFAPPAAIKSPPLSFAARTGDLLFISGIPGFDDKGDLPENFEAQFANVVTNIKRVLDEAGATFRDLVKLNVLLTRAGDVATMNALYASAFGPAPYPARTTCVVQALPNPKMLIEIEGVASLAGR